MYSKYGILNMPKMLNPVYHNNYDFLTPYHTYFVGSLFASISVTSFTTSAAGSKLLETFCRSAVVLLNLNKPRARLRSPCKRHASTAPGIK